MLETKKTRFNSLHLSAIFFLALVVTAAVYLTGDENKVIIRKQGTRIDEHNTTKKQQTTSSSDSASDCNLFSGRWIFDNASSPLYREEQCSFMDNEYACQKYGRRDAKYQLWRWRPHECDLPRERANLRITIYKQKMCHVHNKKVWVRRFQVGDLVWRRADALKHVGKLEPNWVGPFQIERVLAGGAYKLFDDKGHMLPRSWNVSHLKKYYA